MPDWLPVEEARRGNKKALATLLEGLADEDRYRAEAAGDALPYVGKRALKPLLAVLQDRTAPMSVRSLAADSLSRFDTPEATEAILSIVRDPEEDIELRRWVTRYLASARSEEAFRALSQLLVDEEADHGMRESALSGLTLSLDLRAVAPLLQLARGKDRKFRRKAVRALHRLGGAERYSREGLPQLGPRPRRFRQPLPTLPPPPGGRYFFHPNGTSFPGWGQDSEVVLMSDLDLAAVQEYYEALLRRAHFAREETHLNETMAWSRWTFETAWFREGVARLAIRRPEAEVGGYELELTARWLPAHRISTVQLRSPFGGDDEDEEPDAATSAFLDRVRERYDEGIRRRYLELQAIVAPHRAKLFLSHLTFDREKVTRDEDQAEAQVEELLGNPQQFEDLVREAVEAGGGEFEAFYWSHGFPPESGTLSFLAIYRRAPGWPEPTDPVVEKLQELPLLAVSNTSTLRRADLEEEGRKAGQRARRLIEADRPDNTPLDWDEAAEIRT